MTVAEALRAVVIVAHLAVAAVWFGSMCYSLAVVAPTVAGFFADEQRREEFLVTLANGNRWKVVALIAVLMSTGLAVAVDSNGWARIAYAVAVALDAIAATIFRHVSWRHWPARVFALPEELAGYRRRLRAMAVTMAVLVGTGFVVALLASVSSGR